MISPSVRVSFAIRLRRVSATDGNTGVVGVMAGVANGVGVPGVTGVNSPLLVDGAGDCGGARFSAFGTAATRRTSADG